MSESIRRLTLTAEALPILVNRLVFVGGGVTELLITDAAGRKPRATKDLDCIIEVASSVNYHGVEKILRESGFSHDRGDPPVICRWLKGELILDVMPTIGGIVGPSNIWCMNYSRQCLLEKLRLENRKPPGRKSGGFLVVESSRLF